MQRLYYRLILETLSPLSIGSGADENTDHDILRDGEDKAFIPGTSLAGVLRERLKDDALAMWVFGAVNDRSHEQSRVFVSDALLKGEAVVSRRDSVALNEYKTAIDTLKFDREIVQPGAQFEAFLEIPKGDEHQPESTSTIEAIADALLASVVAEGLLIGGKVTRGFGATKVTAQKICFKDVNSWLAFDPYIDMHWMGSTPLAGKAANVRGYTLALRLRGAISIRDYYVDSDNTRTGEDKNVPDYEQMTNANGAPVIPGTSWAGAFRRQFQKLGAPDDIIRELFGWADPQKKDIVTRSKISFSETTLTGGESKIITRNAIDRFSGKAKDQALYTERTHYGGEGILLITLANDADSAAIPFLEAAIKDLDNGFMAVGGLTAIGRGLFTIINDPFSKEAAADDDA